MTLPSWFPLRYLLKLRAGVPGLRRQHRLEAMVGPLGYWKELRAYQLNLLRQNGLAPHHRFLDVGCGPLQGGIAFIDYLNPGGYTGVDISPQKLAEGYRQIAQFALANKNPRLVISQTFGSRELVNPTFDYLWASQILYYFDRDRLARLFEIVARWMAPDGRFLGDILGECEPQFRTDRHLKWIRSVQPHTVEVFEEVARGFDLQARSLGAIRQFGYPAQLNLRSNVLIEITRRSTETGRAEAAGAPG